MNLEGAIVLAPATFGYGPASHAVSVARALRQKSDMRIVAVADGAITSYLGKCMIFDAVFEANSGDLPAAPEFKLGMQCVVVAITEFARAIAAKKRGFAVVVVDALYWMWRSDPMDVRTADAYLCLAFPGVAYRIAQIQPPCRTLKEIPQIAEPEPRKLSNPRTGLLLNFGGGITPFGFSYDYAATVVQVVQDAIASVGSGELLVTCSDVARTELESRGIRADIQSLALHEMIRELLSRSVLITLPGLSIMWEAVRTHIPTFVLPGISYSQHQLVKEYKRFFQGVSFFTWDELPGYGLLPPGMDEAAGVRAATNIADTFARDSDGIQRLKNWLTPGLLRAPVFPSLIAGHPWGDFSGAEKVADEVLHLLSR